MVIFHVDWTNKPAERCLQDHRKPFWALCLDISGRHSLFFPRLIKQLCSCAKSPFPWRIIFKWAIVHVKHHQRVSFPTNPVRIEPTNIRILKNPHVFWRKMAWPMWFFWSLCSVDFPVDQWVSTKPGLTKHTWWDDPPMFSSYKHHEDFNELMIEKPRTWPIVFKKKYC